MRASSLCAGLAAAVFVFTPISAFAQDKALREAQLRAQRAIGKLQQEKSALEREKDEFAAKAATADKELSALKAEASRLRQRVAAADRELVPLRKEHDDLKQRLDAVEKQLSQTSGQCREAQQTSEQTQKRLEADRAATALVLKQQGSAAQSCVDTNTKLYGLARELARQYEKIAAGKADPVFGLDRVKIENQMQDYRDKIDELKLAPAQRP